MGGVAVVPSVAVPQITRSTPYDQLPQWLTVAEAASYLGVNTFFIYQNVHRGDIPHRRMGPRFILIPREYFDPSSAKQEVTA
jgi:excisionase family DNA binding protein